ncbi:MAG: TauD/TfdA family dioxygenase [Azospirillaceae bacterium]
MADSTETQRAVIGRTGGRRDFSGYRLIEVRPFAPNLGAEIRGVTLADGLSEAEFAEVHRAFVENQVIFFKDQKPIPPAVHIAIGRMFGELHAHPAAPHMEGHPEIFVIHAHAGSRIANGEFWHSDVSCDAEPPLGTMLQIQVMPDCGGDTLFADSYAAWETLSPPLRAMLEGLTARHEGEHIYRGRYAERGVADEDRTYPVAVHPIARTHPESGRKALYVNRTFTTRIPELSQAESDALLALLFDHAERVEFQIRFRWSVNDMAFWDNRCVMHRAIWDYWPAERKGNRVTVKGERPF